MPLASGYPITDRQLVFATRVRRLAKMARSQPGLFETKDKIGMIEMPILDELVR
jgi:hypothetical protein